MLVEKNFVTFPQTTNSPNPDYVAQINVSNGKALGPGAVHLPRPSSAAALAYLKSLNGRLVVRVPRRPKPAVQGR